VNNYVHKKKKKIERELIPNMKQNTPHIGISICRGGPSKIHVFLCTPALRQRDLLAAPIFHWQKFWLDVSYMLHGQLMSVLET